MTEKEILAKVAEARRTVSEIKEALPGAALERLLRDAYDAGRRHEARSPLCANPEFPASTFEVWLRHRTERAR